MTTAPAPNARPTNRRRPATLRRHALSMLVGSILALSAAGATFAAGTGSAPDRSVGQGMPPSHITVAVIGGDPDVVTPGGHVAARRDEPPDDSIPSALLILAAAGIVASVLGRTSSRRHR
jgi:hypothetical protein